jgi:hypothetical protein
MAEVSIARKIRGNRNQKSALSGLQWRAKVIGREMDFSRAEAT